LYHTHAHAHTHTPQYGEFFTHSAKPKNTNSRAASTSALLCAFPYSSPTITLWDRHTHFIEKKNFWILSSLLSPESNIPGQFLFYKIKTIQFLLRLLCLRLLWDLNMKIYVEKRSWYYKVLYTYSTRQLQLLEFLTL
jgi:hypothetical protein